MKTKQTYSSVVIFALLLFVSLNASSFISGKNALAAKTRQVEQLKNSVSYSDHMFPDKLIERIDCTAYILMNLDRGEVFYCESPEDIDEIIARYPTPPDSKGWEVSINDGKKIICDLPGSGCTPTFCAPNN